MTIQNKPWEAIKADKAAAYPENAFGKRPVYCYDEIPSTNEKAKELALNGAEEGTIVIADRQSAGKGRRGRVWSSEKGSGIYMSMILRPKIETEHIPGITLLGALAVADAIKKQCGADVSIKWPNDILVAKKKICGILTEMHIEEDGDCYVILGIGINVNQEKFPSEIENKASSLFLETGKKTDRNRLAAYVAESFDGYYRQFAKEQNLSFIVDRYNQILINKGKTVKIYHGLIEEAKEEQIETGVAMGIDTDGALLVEQNGRIQKVAAGEVSVRGMDGYV